MIAGDATTVTKSGKQTLGLGRFFSSIYSRAVPGIAFQTLSLIDVEARHSWPILVEQMQPKPPAVKPPKKTQQKPHSHGRPKVSKNKNRREVVLNTEMTQVQSMLNQLLVLIGETLRPVYFVYDGAFGNNAAKQMTRQVGLHLISKLHNNAALYFEWKGAYAGKGRCRRYGLRVDYKTMDETHLVSEGYEKGVRCRTYQFRAVHKKFADVLNVVVICKFNEATGKSA